MITGGSRYDTIVMIWKRLANYSTVHCKPRFKLALKRASTLGRLLESSWAVLKIRKSSRPCLKISSWYESSSYQLVTALRWRKIGMNKNDHSLNLLRPAELIKFVTDYRLGRNSISVHLTCSLQWLILVY